MIHHYNYSTSLSHFLSYHQFDDQSNVDPEQTSNSIIEEDGRCKSNSSATNKSFTIAAILGLQNGQHHHPQPSHNLISDHQLHHHHHHHPHLHNPNNPQVVNLSTHNNINNNNSSNGNALCNRLPSIPDAVRHHQQHQAMNVAMNVAAAAAAAVAVAGNNPFAAAVGNGATSNGTGNRNSSSVRGLKHLSHQAIGSKKTCKSKRVRTIFTPEQLERLEAEFERQQYMVGPERLYLAHTLQLTEAQVKVWFQNRRIKWRKHHLEITHQRLAALKQQQQQMLIDDNNADAQDCNSSSNDT